MSHAIAQLIADKNNIVCVGAGGVGKTTASAVLGVAAAQMGRRALVLTVDPARRLAQALGLQALDEHVQRIDVQKFSAQGCAVQVPLDVAMLDVKRTFDRVIGRYAPTPQARDAILEHRFYKQASTALAGTQEYMAMERLYESATGGDYDLVILDTPPSAHALDFLDAPDRLVGLFDSRAFRLLLRPAGTVRHHPFRSGSVVMRGLSRFTGGDMFAHLLEFFGYLSETFDGFVARARQVQTLLRSPQTAFVLVSACDRASTEQALYLGERLGQLKMQVQAMIVNRVAPFAQAPATAGSRLETALAAALDQFSRDGAGTGRDFAKESMVLSMVARSLAGLACADQQQLEAIIARTGQAWPILAVPRTEQEPDNLAALAALAEQWRLDPAEPATSERVKT